MNEERFSELLRDFCFPLAAIVLIICFFNPFNW